MIRQNLHTHTLYDDGRNTPMEMARAALDAGLASLGFSGHSILPFPNDWSLSEEKLPAYLAAVEETKAAFAGRLAVYSGLEFDSLSRQDTRGFDYVIGSVHHIALEDGVTPSIDNTPDETRGALARLFGGDNNAMLDAFFAQYDVLARNPDIDIVGHFDIISKFDETDGIFDGSDPFYLDRAMAAMETLLRADKIFEVNTGAMSRGWRTAPYPSERLLREILARGGRVTVTSDSHSAGTIAHAFAETEARLRALGFRELWEYAPGGFVPVGI